MAKVKVWYQLRVAPHNPSLIPRTLVGTGKPRGFSAALLALWAIGCALQNAIGKLLDAIGKLLDAIRAFRIPPNHETAAPTTIDCLAKPKPDRQSPTAKHTAFSTG
jgi:hypothetical protein